MMCSGLRLDEMSGCLTQHNEQIIDSLTKNDLVLNLSQNLEHITLNCFSKVDMTSKGVTQMVEVMLK